MSEGFSPLDPLDDPPVLEPAIRDQDRTPRIADQDRQVIRATDSQKRVQLVITEDEEGQLVDFPTTSASRSARNSTTNPGLSALPNPSCTSRYTDPWRGPGMTSDHFSTLPAEFSENFVCRTDSPKDQGGPPLGQGHRTPIFSGCPGGPGKSMHGRQIAGSDERLQHLKNRLLSVKGTEADILREMALLERGGYGDATVRSAEVGRSTMTFIPSAGTTRAQGFSAEGTRPQTDPMGWDCSFNHVERRGNFSEGREMRNSNSNFTPIDHTPTVSETSHRNVKPATYDGSTNLTSYLRQFEMVATLCRWSEETKAIELAINLRGPASDLLSNISPEHLRNYHYLRECLIQRFEPANQRSLYVAQLKNRLRKKNESIPELAVDLQRLVRLAHPTLQQHERDQLVLDYFGPSLNDSTLMQTISIGRPKSLADAISMVMEVEADMSCLKPPMVCREVKNTEHLKPDVHSPQEDILARLAKVEAEQRSQRERNDQSSKNYQNGRNDRNGQKGNQNSNYSQRGKGSDVQCYYCGNHGHYKRNCPHLDKQEQHPYNKYHNPETKSFQNAPNAYPNTYYPNAAPYKNDRRSYTNQGNYQ